MSDDLFDDQSINTETKTVVADPAPTPAPTTPNYDDLLSMVVNEQGEQKYKSVEDAIKALNASQQFIETLKTENLEAKTLAADLQSKVKTQEELAELLGNQPSTDDPQAAPAAVAPSLTKEDVLNVLDEQAQALVRKENVSAVRKAVEDAFGGDPAEKLKELTVAKGLSQDLANKMAVENPTAFLDFIGVEQKAPPVEVPPSVSTGNFQITPPEKPKSVMGATSNDDLVSAWRENCKRVNAELGIK